MQQIFNICRIQSRTLPTIDLSFLFYRIYVRTLRMQGTLPRHFHRPRTKSSTLLCLQKCVLVLPIFVGQKDLHVHEGDFCKLQPVVWSVYGRANKLQHLKASLWPWQCHLLCHRIFRTFRIEPFPCTTPCRIHLFKSNQNEFDLSPTNTYSPFYITTTNMIINEDKPSCYIFITYQRHLSVTNAL